MSTLDRRPTTHPPLVAGQRLDRATFHERYEAMPPGIKAELIGGVVHMPSPVHSSHGRMSALIALWLGNYVTETPGLDTGGDATTFLNDDSVPQPDAH